LSNWSQEKGHLATKPLTPELKCSLPLLPIDG
jgi:hypothetical protein